MHHSIRPQLHMHLILIPTFPSRPPIFNQINFPKAEPQNSEHGFGNKYPDRIVAACWDDDDGDVHALRGAVVAEKAVEIPECEG